MGVLVQPRCKGEPIPWDEPKGLAQSFSTGLPIEETGDEQNPVPPPTGETGGVTNRDVQRIRKEGYEAGYRDGFWAGQQEGERQGREAEKKRFQKELWREKQHFRQLLHNLEKALRKELTTFFERTEAAVTELALDIARKVVEVEVTTNKEVVRRAVEKALRELKGTTITLRLHPDDFSLLGDDLSLINLNRDWSVRLVSDERVERGGVIAESEHGLVDLQPSTKFALLQAEVL